MSIANTRLAAAERVVEAARAKIKAITYQDNTGGHDESVCDAVYSQEAVCSCGTDMLRATLAAFDKFPETSMKDVLGCYARYTTEEHAHLVEVWPELATNLVVAKTFKEARDMANLIVIDRLIAAEISTPIRWYYKPHSETSGDPMDRFGSVGWKTVPQSD